MQAFVERAVLDSPLVKNFQTRQPNIKLQIINSYKDLDHNNIQAKNLIFTQYKGQFIEKCPGTKNYICCNYFVIHWAMGCPMNCTYCYLNGYQNTPGIIIHANLPDLFLELASLANSRKDFVFRLGTGEFADSLALENILGYNELLLPQIWRYPNLQLELKTKSADTKSLFNWLKQQNLSVQQKQQLIFAWSVNSWQIIAQEEFETAKLEARLAVAKEAQSLGFLVALHFDPLIEHDGWQNNYTLLIEKIFQYLDPRKIAWVSIGALRFNKKVKQKALQKFSATKIYYGELVLGNDHKYRYFRQLRVEIFKLIYAKLRHYLQVNQIYFCMESPEIWQEVVSIANDNFSLTSHPVFR